MRRLVQLARIMPLFAAVAGLLLGAGSLAVTVGQGDNGPAVKAVQALLIGKRSAGLSAGGAFGPAPQTAVGTLQSHAGSGVDGVVGPTTWIGLDLSMIRG